MIRKLGDASRLSNSKPKIIADRIARKVIQSPKAPSKKLFTKQIIRAYRDLRRRTPNDSELSRTFSIKDINNALLFMKNGKASGFDAIYPEFLIFSGLRTRLWLSLLFTNVLILNDLPASYKKSKIIALLKLVKPDDLPGSYRPIALLSVTFKLFERLLYNRIVTEIDKLVPDEQAGFRCKHSCAEQVLTKALKHMSAIF